MTRAAQQHLRHVDFLNTLSTGNHLRSDNTRIVSDHHRLQTVTTNKICLSAFDNKRYILPDGIKTLPFGHYGIIDYAIDEIDLDHCHYSGKFLGWAHEKCNRLRRNINFTPVVGHNIQNYDLHHICLALNNCEPTTTISVIPATDEKYISMTFGVLIDTFVTEKGKTVKVYEYLRFIDSFKMMNSSLEKLVEIVPDDRFEIMRAMFSTLSDANLQLLKQKGYYPYSYVTGRSKFSDTSLPPLSKWGNTLDGGAVKVTETNLQHARRMWEILECGTLQDYHDSYLKLDCALLACDCEFH